MKKIIVAVIVFIALVALSIYGLVDCWSSSGADSFWGKAVDCGG
jgi:hypothetical protein